MRNMSFALTEKALTEGRKDVTRRKGWTFLTPGDQVCAVRKSMGLKKGETVHRLGVCTIVSVRRERLHAGLTPDEVVREGFAHANPLAFEAFVHDHCGLMPDDVVTRIEFTFTPRDQRKGGES